MMIPTEFEAVDPTLSILLVCFINKAGVKRISLHGLRHTNATIFMKEGINPKIVSERLGHSNVGITLDFYSHTDLDIQTETVNKLENMFQ